MPRFVTCGPNEAIIVSGCCRSNPTIRAGGRVFVWPIFHRIQRLSLNTMTLNVESSKVYSEAGVPVTVKGVAQVKIQGKDLASLRAASEMFLDKSEDEVMEIAKATLDGHQRSMIASMRIEDIYKNRHEFSKNVQQSAQTDLIDMGLTLVSYTVQDISDDEGYLDAVGQEKTVVVRSDARKIIAEAKAQSDCKNMEVEEDNKIKSIINEQQIALKNLDFELLKAKHLLDEAKDKAKIEKAGELKGAEMDKQLAEQKRRVKVLEKTKEKELILKKKQLKELELMEEIRSRADYECEREKELALAYMEKTKAEATAEAEKIKRLAEAKAEVIAKQRDAEAEVLRERAQAFMQFGDSAKLEMVLAILPRLTAEIAGPITECNKITSVSQDGSVGFSRITNEIMEVVEQICHSVSHITGQSLAAARGNNDDHPGPSGYQPRKSSTESTTTTTTTATLADRTRMMSSFSRIGRP